MAAEKKPTARKKKQSLSMEVEGHRFAPGTKVGVYRDLDVAPYRNSGREPMPEAISNATVGKDGALEVEAEEPGAYAIAGKPEGSEKWQYLTVTLKKDE